jgi:hypothetical protein
VLLYFVVSRMQYMTFFFVFVSYQNLSYVQSMIMPKWPPRKKQKKGGAEVVTGLRRLWKCRIPSLCVSASNYIRESND